MACAQGRPPTASTARIEFLPGGVVRTTSVDDGTSDDGRWTLAGDDLRIEVDDAEELEAMVGKVEGDRIDPAPDDRWRRPRSSPSCASWFTRWSHR